MHEHSTKAILETEFDILSAGLEFKTKNNGVHLKVYDGGKFLADVWPTTGRAMPKGRARSITPHCMKRFIEGLTK